MTERDKTAEAEPRWEHFPHVADMGVRGFGPTRAEAFARAAEALSAIICDPTTIRPQQVVEIRCEAPDDELLLVDWLNALIYEMAIRRMVFGRFELRIDDHTLCARIYGEPVDRLRHQPAVEVKGATYTELKVAQESDGHFVAQCVVDV